MTKTPYEELFGKDENIEGKHVKIDGTSFLVIGVIEYKKSWRNNRLLIPITTAQNMYNSGSTRVHNIDLVVKASLSVSKQLEDKIRSLFSRKYDFKKGDKRAIDVDNNIEEYANAQGVIVGIKFFVIMIGVLTLISGITGILNFRHYGYQQHYANFCKRTHKRNRYT